MLLVIDVGNTNIKLGIFKEERLVTSFRMTTSVSRTSDEIGVIISDLLNTCKIGKEDLEAAIISSVVPNIMHSLKGAVRRYLGIEAMVVGPGIKTGIKLTNENPREMGADRICDAVAAYEMYGGPVLVIDYGTATKYDLINEKGEFGVGITAQEFELAQMLFGTVQQSCQK